MSTGMIQSLSIIFSGVAIVLCVVVISVISSTRR